MVVNDGGFLLGMNDGSGLGPNAGTSRIAEQRSDRVEAHRLVVDEADEEFNGMVDLEPTGGIGDEGEGDGVAFRKAIEGKGADGFDYFLLHLDVDVTIRHAITQFFGNCSHAFVGSLEGHGASQFIGFCPIEAGNDHGHAEDLFLEKRNAEGAAQNRFEGWMDTIRWFAAITAVEIGMDEVAHDGAGSNERNFDGEIIEGARLHDG